MTDLAPEERPQYVPPWWGWAPRQGARLWIGIGVLLAGLTAALLLSLFLSTIRERGTVIEAAETRNQARAEVAMESLGALIARTDGTLRDIGFRTLIEVAGNVGRQYPLQASLDEALLLNSGIAMITVHDSRGQILVGSTRDRPVPESILGLALFTDHLDLSIDFRIGVPQAVSGSGMPLIPFSRRVDAAQGDLWTIVTAWMPVQTLVDILRPEGLPAASAISITDPSGAPIVTAWRDADGPVSRQGSHDLPPSLSPSLDCLTGPGNTMMATLCDPFRVDALRLPTTAHGVFQVTDLRFTLALWRGQRLMPTIFIAVGVSLIMAMLMAILTLNVRRLQVSQMALEDQQSRLTAVVQSAPDGILSVNEDLIIEDTNPALEAIFGYGAGDLIGCPLSVLLPPNVIGHHKGLAEAFLRDDPGARRMVRSRSVKARKRNGEAVIVQVGLARTVIGGRPRAIAMVADISDQERRRQELAEKNKIITAQLLQLREASAAKNRFLSAMSHELRTPLNAIIGFSDVLQTDAGGHFPYEKRAEYSRNINESGRYLLSLINNILDVSCLEEKAALLHPEALDLNQVVVGLSHLMSPILDRACLSFNLELATELPPVQADERAVKQIAMNFVSNAAKFTAPGGAVSVRTEVKGDFAELVVADTGIGIPENRIEHLGRPFQQVGDHWSGSASGLGLGLALTKMLAQEMGGDFSIESLEGAWTRASVTIPLVSSSIH